MKRICLIIALCAPLAACNDAQINSAGTIANVLNGLGMQNFRIYEQYRLDSHKITQEQFADDMARANALNSTVNLNIMTVQQIAAALEQSKRQVP